MIWIIIAIVMVVIGGIWALRMRQRQVSDGVDSFRRQIDALSPEARRPVIDQVQKQSDDVGDDEEDGADGA